MPGFARFLQTAAATNAQLINYSNVARDAQVARQTVVQWYQILYDTFVGFELEAFTSTRKRKAIETAKFYFFDTGVVRGIGRPRHEDGINIWPLEFFLERLWSGAFVAAE